MGRFSTYPISDRFDDDGDGVCLWLEALALPLCSAAGAIGAILVAMVLELLLLVVLLLLL
jgi:hypothetical protein